MAVKSGFGGSAAWQAAKPNMSKTHSHRRSAFEVVCMIVILFIWITRESNLANSKIRTKIMPLFMLQSVGASTL